MANISNEQAKKNLQVIITNTVNGSIDKVVNLQHTQIGTATTAKDLTVTGELNVTGGALLSGSSRVVDLRSMTNAHIFGHRLTLTSGSAVTTADVTGASTMYLTEFTSNMLALWDGTEWAIKQTPQVSFTFSGSEFVPPVSANAITSGSNYDMFVAWVNNAVTLEKVKWTSSTARSSALTRKDGVVVKSGDPTRRYVGTIRGTGTNTTEDSVTSRFVWNMYNRVTRKLKVTESTNSWTYSTATWRQVRLTSTNKFEYVVGLSEDPVSVVARALAICSGGAHPMASGVGIDSSLTNSADVFGTNAYNAFATTVDAPYTGYPGLGYHAIVWLEAAGGVATMTWYGNAGNPTFFQSGMTGNIRA